MKIDSATDCLRDKILLAWLKIKNKNIHKEKQRGCPLLGANRYTHIYISYICVYILFICLRL